MHACIRGLLSGAVATAVLAALLWLNGTVGPLRELDLVALIARVLGESRSTGWLLLGLIGVAGCGLALAALAEPDQAGPPWGPTATLGGAAWLALMMGLLPMAGYEPFGLGIGLHVPLVTAVWAGAYAAAMATSWTWLPRLPEWLQHGRGHAAPTAAQRS